MILSQFEIKQNDISIKLKMKLFFQWDGSPHNIFPEGDEYFFQTAKSLSYVKILQWSVMLCP